MKKIIKITIALLCFFSFTTFAQTVEGTWESVDDETGEKKSHIQIYQTQSGTYVGKVVKILRVAKVDAKCDKCNDYRKGKPVMGMFIISGMKEDTKGKTWGSGKILDPEKGKEYSCKMTLKNNNTLEVRGFVGMSFIGRTQTWSRVN
jgi:uncharacterized protein (DUF2147 family)